MLEKTSQILDQYKMNAERREKIDDQLARLTPGVDARIFLVGTYYAGPPNKFSSQAKWRPILIHQENDHAFVNCFNTISHDPKIENAQSYGKYLTENFEQLSERGLANDFIYATNGAKNEKDNVWDKNHRGMTLRTTYW